MTNKYKWKLCNGQTQQVFDHFKSITWFSQNELQLQGFVTNVQQNKIPNKNAKLKAYVDENINHASYEKYIKYWKETSGLEDISNLRVDIWQSDYIEQYIKDNNLYDDYHKFINDNYLLFVDDYSKMQAIDAYIYETIQPVFNEVRGNYIFIYRNKDGKGILIER